MKSNNHLILSTATKTLPARKPRLPARALCRRTRRCLTGKEQDAETGLYYYGARYLDSRTGRWLPGIYGTKLIGREALLAILLLPLKNWML